MSDRLSLRGERLDLVDVGRLESLRALGDLELDGLALLESLVPFALDGGEVDEDVRSILLLDESVPLAVIEPLHFSPGHWARPLLSSKRGAVTGATASPGTSRAGQKKSTKATALVDSGPLSSIPDPCKTAETRAE